MSESPPSFPPFPPNAEASSSLKSITFLETKLLKTNEKVQRVSETEADGRSNVKEVPTYPTDSLGLVPTRAVRPQALPPALHNVKSPSRMRMPRERKEGRTDDVYPMARDSLSALPVGNPISGGTSSLAACTVSKLTLVVERRAPLGEMKASWFSCCAPTFYSCLSTQQNRKQLGLSAFHLI